MSNGLWFHLTGVIEHAEHALTATDHYPDPARVPQHVPALVCVVGNGVRLVSSGSQPTPPMPVFAEGHRLGTHGRYRAVNNVDLPNGATHLHLTAATADRPPLIDRLREAAGHGKEWLSLDMSSTVPTVAFHTDPEPVEYTVPLEPTLVAIDDVLGPYPALVQAGCDWNGWAIPSFTPEVVARIAEDTQRLATDSRWPDGIEVARMRGGRVEVVSHPGTSDEHITVIEPDTNGRYGVGAMAWTWSVIDEHANCLQECQCGTGCSCPEGCMACGEPVDGGHATGCPWTAGSAFYERPAIAAQQAVRDVHRHRPGCPLVRRCPGPLFTDDFVRQCRFCGDTGCLDAHTLRTGDLVEHHQRCTNCGETWSAIARSTVA